MTNTIKTALKEYFKQLEATNITIDLDNGDYYADLKEGDVVVMTNSRGAKGFMLVVFNNVEQSFLVLSKSRYGTFSTPYYQRSYESIETFHKSDWLDMQETISKHNQRLVEVGNINA